MSRHATSANTIAKIGAGICDTLLLSVARAWDDHDGTGKPKLMCPAMNTAMWQQCVTRDTVALLEGRGWGMVAPVAKVKHTHILTQHYYQY